ncbi:hypothetical protein FZEAL_5101 [Fusarium zealandicum]|uniref:Cell wall mannoprotein PIR1-like C-terminal domain-containing protein n=1 Tax=Fusarium zealandicum TaxID=1053134 RepID=A0A8H4XKX7_9HYPO|nr:hypothetical protein FZEAL_5101 [Fusarium zealandicum]
MRARDKQGYSCTGYIKHGVSLLHLIIEYLSHKLHIHSNSHLATQHLKVHEQITTLNTFGTMRTSLTLLALAAAVFAAPQAVTDDIKPKGSAPDGCSASYDGKFEVTIFKSGKSKRDLLQKRSCNGEGVLVMTLEDGVLKDAQGRTGYISESYQFQFDEPAQSGAVYTAGFSVCSNGTLALGSSAVFWQCQSGDFYNLYDRHWADQCSPVEFGIMGCGGKPKVAAKKRVVGSSIVATTVVTVVSAGVTKEVPTTIVVPMCQIGDGQVQVRTTPCDDMELPIITAPPISQVSDGKLQVPTTAPPAPPAPVQPEGQPGGEPSEPEDTPEGDEPSNNEGSDQDVPAATGGEPSAEPTGEPAPGEDSGSDTTPSGDGAPANSGEPADADEPAVTGGPAATGEPAETGEITGADEPTGTDEPEVLVTDTAAAPSRTQATGSSDDGPTRAVKPFRPQSSSDSYDEESDSSPDSPSSDEDASSESASPESSGLKILPGAGITVMLGLLGALIVL